MGPVPLQVAVVSRHQLTRAGLTALLAGERDRVVIFDVSAQDGHLGGHDVTLYDLAGLVDTDENDLRHLLASRVPVVALAPQGRSDLSEGAVHLGVAGVVAMDVTAAQLVTALQSAASGDRLDAGEMQRARRARLLAESGLTEREASVLELIAQGHKNSEIADELFLSVNSVKTYIRAAYRKIGAHNRAQAVLWSVRHALVDQVDPDSGEGRGSTDLS